MNLLANRVICPFCFRHVAVSELHFRCTNSRCSGITEDIAYAEAQGLPTPPILGRVFAPPSGNIFNNLRRGPRSAECSTCNRETTKQVCPYCHFDMLHDVGQIPEKMIAVIGGRGTGKSNYIGTLIDRLQTNVGRDFKFGVLPRGDNTLQRYENDFHNWLYRDRRPIPPTQSASVDPRVKAPLVFRLTFGQARTAAVNLVLFDTAGEDLTTMQVMENETRYIIHADAIIFLLDPLQLTAVRELLLSVDPNIELPPREPRAEPMAIISRLRDLYEQKSGLRTGRKLEKPIAFVLSKIDMLYTILDPSSLLRQTGEHLGKFNRADMEAVHAEIVNYMEEWTGTRLPNIVEPNFGYYRYFGVSSLGKAPVNNELEAVTPIRVEDPLLWLFSEFRLIQDKKD